MRAASMTAGSFLPATPVHLSALWVLFLFKPGQDWHGFLGHGTSVSVLGYLGKWREFPPGKTLEFLSQTFSRRGSKLRRMDLQKFPLWKKHSIPHPLPRMTESQERPPTSTSQHLIWV